MKSKIYNSFLFLSTTIFTSLCLAQSPGMLWHKSYGGSSDDIFTCMDFTTDGGYILGGSSTSSNGDVSQNNGNGDYWIVKVDAAGNMLWEKSYGGSSDEWVKSVEQTTDGGYIVSGVTYSNDGNVLGHHGQTDAWILKLDASGGIVWKQCLGGSFSEDPSGIVQTSDGGYVVISQSTSSDGDITTPTISSDYWMVKLDASGNILWDKSIDNNGNSDYPMAMKPTSDGGFVVAGTTNASSDEPDNWIVKLDALGNVEWDQVVGGSNDDTPMAIDQVLDGGFVVSGMTQSNDGDVQGFHGAIDFWVVKIDANGNLLWTNALGGSLNEYAWGICSTAQGGCVAIGISGSTDGDVGSLPGQASAWLVNLDASGNLIDEVALGGSYAEDGRVIRQMSNGEFVFAGTTLSNDGDFSNNHGASDAWLVNLGPWSLSGMDEFTSSTVEVFPNPVKDKLIIRVEESSVGEKYFLMDDTGRIVMDGKVSSESVEINMFSLAPGTYHLKINDQIVKEKIIKV
jgi:hypothetical protein